MTTRLCTECDSVVDADKIHNCKKNTAPTGAWGLLEAAEREAKLRDITPQEAVARLLMHLGEDPNREGLRQTGARVVKALEEMTAGKKQDPKAILATQFAEPCDEMVLCKNISFTSLCEHHLLPFSGSITIGYLPREKVVGLSKMVRLVHCFARRLQIQERLTRQIAEAMMEHLQPSGVGVVASAEHGCMRCRGVREPNALMLTSSLLGVFREKADVRSEFYRLAGAA